MISDQPEAPGAPEPQILDQVPRGLQRRAVAGEAVEGGRRGGVARRRAVGRGKAFGEFGEGRRAQGQQDIGPVEVEPCRRPGAAGPIGRRACGRRCRAATTPSPDRHRSARTRG
ncbi:hypothetical protein [Paracoccus mutanolyticus]|uniref:hypothetical protein n=1 Tax=Paracoccus mutanolyticus TaxID=1499308 RepID=UPI001678E261|nr:hypothetical protein [Paracoccus mutanolyticus]